MTHVNTKSGLLCASVLTMVKTDEQRAAERLRLLVPQLVKEIEAEGAESTQTEIAQRLGIGQSVLSFIMSERRGLGLKIMNRICTRLSLSPEYFTLPRLETTDYRRYLKHQLHVIEGGRSEPENGARNDVEAFIAKHSRKMTAAHAEEFRRMNFSNVTEAYLMRVWQGMIERDEERAPDPEPINVTPRPGRKKLHR